MEVSICAQALGMADFSLLGLGLGLVYDVLRPLRYEGRAAWLWDGVFCALAAFGCFALSMSGGRLGIWEILAALIFFCLYINLLSPLLLPPLLRIYSLFLRISILLSEKTKILSKFVKKIFTNFRN